eukprot:scaffold8467_cov64-Phaeocystis_antarctica.AAC.3
MAVTVPLLIQTPRGVRATLFTGTHSSPLESSELPSESLYSNSCTRAPPLARIASTRAFCGGSVTVMRSMISSGHARPAA